MTFFVELINAIIYNLCIATSKERISCLYLLFSNVVIQSEMHRGVTLYLPGKDHLSGT